MKLVKSTSIKTMIYEYNNLDELEFHFETMKTAKFRIDYLSREKLIGIYSQIEGIECDENEQGVTL